MHKAGKGNRSISKDLGIQQSMIRQIVYKWRKFMTVVTVHRSGHPAKITPRAQWTILK